MIKTFQTVYPTEGGNYVNRAAGASWFLVTGSTLRMQTEIQLSDGNGFNFVEMN
jgi:hypothetical protein